MKRKLFFILNLILITVLTLVSFFVPLGMNSSLIFGCLLIFYFIFYQSLKKPLYIIDGIKTYIKIDTFFMLFFYVIYYYPYQLYILGLKDLSSSPFLNYTYPEFTNKAIIIATIGLLTFQFGFKSNYTNKSTIKYFKISKVYLKSLTYIIFSFIVLVLFMTLRSNIDKLIIGPYKGSKTDDITFDAIFTLVTYFIVLSVILNTIYYKFYRKLNFLQIIMSVLALLWAIFLLVIGDRNTFFLIAVVYFAGYYSFIKIISIKKIIFFIFLSLFLYQVVELSRNAEKRGIDSIWEAFVQLNSNLNDEDLKTNSFDISTAGNRAGYKVADKYEDFYFGKFKLVALTTIIPYSSRLFLNKTDKVTSSAKVLSNEMIGEFAFWGVGSNIITDCYLDFGVFGVIFLMFFLGKFGGYVKIKMQNNINSPKWIFLYLITIGYYSQISRYDFGFFLRSFVWTYFLFFIINSVFKMKKLNNHESYF